MTRRLVIAALLIAAADPALACHRFSVWHFPWPQRCSVVAEPRPAQPKASTSDDMPLPDLSPITGEEPDEQTRARLIMRARAFDP
jgi:hypothetical protein